MKSGRTITHVPLDLYMYIHHAPESIHHFCLKLYEKCMRGHVLSGVIFFNNSTIKVSCKKIKYMVWQFIINDISHTLQKSPKFSVSGCKSGWIGLHTFTLISCLLNNGKDLLCSMYFFMEYL